MKRFEGLLATGLATATLAAGCGGGEKQSPEIAKKLDRVIQPAALKMAKRAIALSKGENPKFYTYYEDGETSLSRILTPEDRLQSVEVTFEGDESQVNLANLQSIEVEDAHCPTIKGKTDCRYGQTLTLYAPTEKYEGQEAWEARDTGFVSIEDDDIPRGFTIDTVDDFKQGKSAVPTAEELVKEMTRKFNSVVAASDN